MVNKVLPGAICLKGGEKSGESIQIHGSLVTDLPQSDPIHIILITPIASVLRFDR